MSPALRIITPAIARDENFTELTSPINPRTEAEIFRNLERQLAGVDGVWIQHKDGTMSAARRTRDLKFDEPKRRIKTTDLIEAKEGRIQP